MYLHWVSEVNGRVALGGWWRGAVEFLNPQILEVGGTKRKKKTPSYAFPEEETLLWATEKAQDKHALSQQFTSVWLVNLRTPRDTRASLWMRNFPNSKDVDVFSRFIYAPGPKPIVWFNWFKRDSTFCNKKKTGSLHERNLAEWLVLIQFSVGYLLRRSLVLE